MSAAGFGETPRGKTPRGKTREMGRNDAMKRMKSTTTRARATLAAPVWHTSQLDNPATSDIADVLKGAASFLYSTM